MEQGSVNDIRLRTKKIVRFSTNNIVDPVIVGSECISVSGLVEFHKNSPISFCNRFSAIAIYSGFNSYPT